MNEYCYDDLMIGDLPKANVLNPEIEQGNTEYKYKLTNLIEEQLKHRITQLNWRLNEGHDIAVYQIGVEDDGNPLGK
jgi:GTPase